MISIRICLVCVAASVSGCVSAPPRVSVGELAAPATGSDVPIEFRVEGEPLDAREDALDFLTLPEAVRRTLKHDPAIQAALARVRAAEADSKQARLLPNPVATVIVRFPHEGGSPDVEAGLTADLISLLSRPGRSSAADSRFRAAAADALSQVLDVLVQVQGRYVAIQTNEELLQVLDGRVAITERLLGIARSRLELGEGTRLDVLALEAQRVELATELTQRRQERSDERLALARLIGEPSGTTEWRVTPWSPGPTFSASEQRWVAVGLEHRPEVQRHRYELAALGAELRLTRFAAFEGADVGVEGERDEGDWAVGPSASVPIPLFDFGQARRARAQAAVSEARHNLTQVRRQVVEETRRAHAAYLASRQNLHRVRGELVPLAERRQEQAEAQFRAGRIDATGLLQAEEELRAARTRQVELERANTEALIRLQRAVGGPGRMGEAAAAAGATPATTRSTTAATTNATRSENRED